MGCSLHSPGFSSTSATSQLLHSGHLACCAPAMQAVLCPAPDLVRRLQSARITPAVVPLTSISCCRHRHALHGALSSEGRRGGLRAGPQAGTRAAEPVLQLHSPGASRNAGASAVTCLSRGMRWQSLGQGQLLESSCVRRGSTALGVTSLPSMASRRVTVEARGIRTSVAAPAAAALRAADSIEPCQARPSGPGT